MARLFTEQEFEDSFDQNDLLNIIGGVPAPTPAPAPFNFKNYIYQGGADDTVATQRGLDYIREQGLTPQQGVDLFNTNLGTNFTLDDYYRATGTQPAASTPAYVAPATPTSIPVTTTAAPATVFDQLQGASLIETPATLPFTTTTTTAAATTTPAAQPPTDPRDLITYLNQTDPNFAQTALNQYKSDYAAASAAAEGAFDKPLVTGTDVSGWNITPFETYRPDPSGFDIPDRQVTEGDKVLGGYNATKTTVGEGGKPIETTISYDPNGAITGSTQRIFTGGDSGYVLQRDANGNIVSASQFDYSESWKGAVLPLANMALMALTGPGSSLASSLTGALAPTLGQGIASQIAANAIIGAGRGAVLGGLSGQDVGSAALRGGIASGAGTALGALGETAGAGASKLIGPYLPEGGVGDFLQSLSGNVAQGIVRDVGGSLVGSALTGRDFDLNTALTSGALSGLTRTVFEEAKGNPMIKALPRELQSTALAALSAQLRGRDPGSAALNALIGSIARGVGQQAKTTTTGGGGGGGGGGEFGTQGFWEGWDSSGGGLDEGISTTGTDQVSVTGTKMPWEDDTTDIVGLFTTTQAATTTQPADQTVSVIGTKDSKSTGDTFLDDLIRESVTLTTTTTAPPEGTTTTTTTQRVTVTNKPVGDTFLDDLIKESVTLTDKTTQRVTVTGKPITTTEAPPEGTTTTSTTQKVTVTDKPITTTEAPGETTTTSTTQRVVVTETTTTTTSLPPGETTTTSTTQRVTVTGKPITTTEPPVVVTTAVPTTTARPTTTAAPTTTTTTTTTTTARPMVSAGAVQQPMSQIQDLGTFKSVFYEKMQREEQQKELARQLQEQENADPYERLMALAEKNPNMAIDELMRIIEGT
jgi:hypothetical protein